MSDIRSKDIRGGADDHLRRRAVAESRRQSAHEQAHRQFAQAKAAERAAWEKTCRAAHARLAKAGAPLEFVPEGYAVGTDETIDKVLAEAGAAQAVVHQLPGAPDFRDLAARRDAAINLADQTFNRQLAAGFPAE